MITRDVKKFAILALVFSMPLLTVAESFPDFPMSFWGNATINGNAASAGSVIRAYYGSTLAGEVVLVENGVYGYTEPTKQKLVVGKGDGPITFKIQSLSVNSGNETSGSVLQFYTGFTSGQTVRQNLDFSIAVAPASTQSSGGGGGGTGGSGGGGGGSGSSPSSISDKGDANNDSKVDILDFNALMIDWGGTGTGNNSDFNNDSKVDIFDFNILMINWSK